METVIGILINKIISLALIMAMGWLLVKCRILEADTSKAISRLTLYLVNPCVTITAFQVDYTPEVKNGLLLALFAAVAIHLFLILATGLLKKTLKLDPVEQLSVMYSNAGNLVIPLVSAMLGKEWVIYTSAFNAVQRILFWSHGKAVLCGDRGFQPRKIFGNINMISILVGLAMFLTGIRLPSLLQDAADSVGSMIGPLAMLVTGMLIGNLELRQLVIYKRVWLITFLRLILMPLSVVLLVKYSGITTLVPGGKEVLLVTVLAAVTPSATSITQLAQVHNKDAQYACAINVITTLLCILTVPIMIALYQV